MEGCSTGDESRDNSSPEASRIVGEWVLQIYAYNGEDYVPEECESQLSVEFFSNGTSTFIKFYELEAEECASYTYNEDWEYMENDTYEFTEEDGESYAVQITFSNNNSTMTIIAEDEDGKHRAVYKKV